MASNSKQVAPSCVSSDLSGCKLLKHAFAADNCAAGARVGSARHSNRAASTLKLRGLRPIYSKTASDRVGRVVRICHKPRSLIARASRSPTAGSPLRFARCGAAERPARKQLRNILCASPPRKKPAKDATHRYNGPKKRASATESFRLRRLLRHDRRPLTGSSVL